MTVEHNNHLSRLSADLEFSGGLNRSAGQGAKFSLMLAMMAEDLFSRPKFNSEEENTLGQMEPDLVSPYPKQTLKPEGHSWSELDVTSELLHQNLRDAQLWQNMHPEPLSLYNDHLRLADEIVDNCDYYTQLRLKGKIPQQNIQETDETGLYDIIQSLEQQPLIA